MSKIYLYVTPFFPSPTNWRGTYCYDFVRALGRQMKVRGEQWNVLVFVPGAGEDYEIGGVKVYRFPTKQLPSNLFPFLFRSFNERSFLNKVNQILSSTGHLHHSPSPKIAICHAHTANFAIYALAAKRAFGCQALLHHHCADCFGLNLGILKYSFLYNTWLFLCMRKLFEQMDCHIFISEMVKRSFLSAPDTRWSVYDGYRRQMRGPAFFRCRPVRITRSVILHNGVDTSLFHPELDTKHQAPSTAFTIGCIGNFQELKDQETLIRAVGKIKKIGGESRSAVDEIRVVFVGSGPTLDRCKKLAYSIVHLSSSASPSPVFEFRSEVRHEELPAFYRSLDLFVLPSYFEGFGCVFTEAHACGVPFITCTGQGADDLLEKKIAGGSRLTMVGNQSLWFCNPHDPDDLAYKISYYMAHRPVQHLNASISLEEIVPQYLSDVSSLK